MLGCMRGSNQEMNKGSQRRIINNDSIKETPLEEGMQSKVCQSDPKHPGTSKHVSGKRVLLLLNRSELCRDQVVATLGIFPYGFSSCPIFITFSNAPLILGYLL